MTSPWGPLHILIGEWASGYDGIDVAFHSDEGKLGETVFREETTYQPLGSVSIGARSLYGLDYRTAIWREGDASPFHTEIGYWLWDETTSQVVRCFIVPHATTLIAGGIVAPDATEMTLHAAQGSPTYGILSTPSLHAVAHTTRFDLTVHVEEDVLRYEQTTTVDYVQRHSSILHTDRNTLRRVAP